MAHRIIDHTNNQRTEYEWITDKTLDLNVEYEDLSPQVNGTSSAMERKQQPVTSGVLAYFPDAIKYIARVSLIGNDQHNPDQPLHWDRSKSGDELDALSRHLIDHTVSPMDTDGVLHLGKVAWRSLAALQKHLENENNA